MANEFGLQPCQASHILGRVRRVQHDKAIVQLYWEAPKGPTDPASLNLTAAET